ncbi:MAG: Cellulase [Acidobacteriaceae bacterium]|nr:Cellulase [Acidobacteriaceae bacterium]
MNLAPVLLLLLAQPAISLSQQPDRTQQLLQRLSGPPGAEEPVRAIMVSEMKPFVTEPIRYDGMGSILNRQDFDQLVDLVVAMVTQMDARTVQELRDFTPKP